ncbi:unnamed protein product [Symbiodinium natans]|uniref:Phytanoyl-CoA dioxygenase n=1 Tax=Symbiodinium natans TaxID=878477 RepID=A0A812R4K3_9DINO|nr:unnamed protein product [Symbiodinium natans]
MRTFRRCRPRFASILLTQAPGSGWNEALRQQGVAVLAGAVPPVEREAILNDIWDWLEGVGSGGAVSRSDPTTWTMSDRRWPRDNMSTGIVCVRGAGQAAGAWRVRGHAAVQSAFAHFWGVEPSQLLTSMDGLILWRPWQQKPAGIAEPWKTRGSWLHADQNVYRRPDLEAIQGLLSLTAADPRKTGGFVCVPGSHLPEAQQELCDLLGGPPRLRKRGDFLALPEGSSLGAGARGASLEPGDLLLWDARLLHGSEPAPGVEHEGEPEDPVVSAPELLRVAVPVCMVPRSFAQDQDELAAWRRKAVSEGITTKHWPHKQRVQGEAGGPDYVVPKLSSDMLRVL